jgi:hypothetical protein
VVIYYFSLYNLAFLSLFLFFQSLALQDGCQKKINLEKIAPMLESAADSHVLAGSEPGFAMVDKACSLGEPITYDHDLLCDKEIHASGSSASANKSAKSCLEKQCSFHEESGCSTTGSLNYIFFLHISYSVDWIMILSTALSFLAPCTQDDVFSCSFSR